MAKHNLLVFDGQREILLAVFSNKENNQAKFDSVQIVEELGKDITLEFSVQALHEDSQYAKEGNLVAYKDLDGHFQLFQIYKVEEEHSASTLMKRVYCEHSVYEIADDIVTDIKVPNGTAKDALTYALISSRWKVGTVDVVGNKTVNFYYTSAIKAVQDVATVFAGELKFRVTISGDKITGRYVDLLTRRGQVTGKRFEFDRDVTRVKRTVDLSEVKTALYGRGTWQEKEEEETTAPLVARTLTASIEPSPITEPAPSFTAPASPIPIETTPGYSLRIENTAINNIEGKDYYDYTFYLETPLADYEFYHKQTTQLQFSSSNEIKDTTIKVLKHPTEPDFFGIFWVSNVDPMYIEWQQKTYRGFGALAYNFKYNGAFQPISLGHFGASESYYNNYGYTDGAFEKLPFGFDFYWLNEKDLIKDHADRLVLSTQWAKITPLTEPRPPAEPPPVEPTKTGKAPKTSFKDVEWKKENGDPVDKPIGMDYVEDLNALRNYGRVALLTGTEWIPTRHRFGVFEYETNDPKELLQKTYEQLRLLSVPNVSYELGIVDLEELTGYSHMKVRIGDTVRVIDKELGLTLEARVVQLERDLEDASKTNVILGNFISDITHYNSKLATVETSLKDKSFEATTTAKEYTRQQVNPLKDVVNTWKGKEDPTKIDGGQLEGTIKNIVETASITGDTGGFTEVSIDRIKNSQNVVLTTLANQSFYVDGYMGSDSTGDGTEVNPFGTIQYAIDCLPTHLKHDVKVLVSGGLYVEEVNVSGFTGIGKVTVEAHIPDVRPQIIGNVIVGQNTSQTFLNDLDIMLQSGSTKNPIHVENAFSIIERCKVTGNGLNAYGVAGLYRAGVRLIDTEINVSADSGVYAAYNSSVDVYNCKGGRHNYGITADGGSFVGGDGTAPLGTVANTLTTFGGTITGIWSEHLVGDFTSEDVTVKSVKETWTSISQGSWRSNDSSWLYNAIVVQGQWDENGLYKGYYFFGTDLTTDLTSPTIQSIEKIRVYLSRASTGGINSKVSHFIRTHEYTEKPAPTPEPTIHTDDFTEVLLGRGEGLWVELPQTMVDKFRSGTAKGFGLYTSDTTNEQYSVMAGIGKIEVTYKTI